MDIKAIVYNSSAGTTRRYAEQLAEWTGLPAVPLKKARKELAGQPVVFMSWICSGVLMYGERAKRLFDLKCICAVGIGTEEQARRDLKTQHELEGEHLFFLPGAFQMRKVKFLHRRLMKDMLLALRAKKADKSREFTKADQESYHMLRYGADKYSEAALEAVRDRLNRGVCDRLSAGGQDAHTVYHSFPHS